jgi:hypothetical protein
MKRRALLATGLSAVGIGGLTAAFKAQERIVTPLQPDRTLSGDDIGFRVEGEGRDGAVKGRFMVKVDGAWKEIELSPRFRIVR